MSRVESTTSLKKMTAVALLTFVVGLAFLPETKDRDIYAHD